MKTVTWHNINVKKNNTLSYTLCDIMYVSPHSPPFKKKKKEKNAHTYSMISHARPNTYILSLCNITCTLTHYPTLCDVTRTLTFIHTIFPWCHAHVHTLTHWDITHIFCDVTRLPPHPPTHTHTLTLFVTSHTHTWTHICASTKKIHVCLCTKLEIEKYICL